MTGSGTQDDIPELTLDGAVLACTAGDVTMTARRIEPACERTNGASVLMFPGATGRGPSFDARAQELAELGYQVFAISAYDRADDLSSPQAAGAHYAALLADGAELRRRLRAWVDVILDQPGVDPARVGAIGYCFGGKCVLELVRMGAPLAAAASFHGLLTTDAPAAPGCFSGDLAVWSGGRDPYAPVAALDELRAEMAAAGVRCQITLFADAQHSFTDPDHDTIGLPGIAYDRLSATVSWAGTLALLGHGLAADRER